MLASHAPLQHFKKKDKPFIEQRKSSLEAEIRSCLENGESTKVFVDDIEGLWFGGAIKQRNGKPISIHAHTKEDMSFLNHANNLMNFPPTKRPFEQTADQNSTLHSNTVNYSSILQARRTLTSRFVSVQDPAGNTSTTTTQTSQITAMVETRFQTIELEIKHQREHQQGMDERLHNLESRATSIDENIASMMAFWKITPKHKRKANEQHPAHPPQAMLTEASDDTAHASEAYFQEQEADLSCV
jgi:hypothetical protein